MKKIGALLIFLIVFPFAFITSANELDTTEEIQAQIDRVSAAGGGIVELPAERIVLEERLNLKNNVHLMGAGIGETILTINPENPDGTVKEGKIVNADRQRNIEISGITFDGNKQERSALINSGNSHTVGLAYVDGFRIHDIEVINSVDASISLWYASNGSIANSVIKNSGSNGILGMQDTHHVNVLNNIIDQTDNQNGIFFMYQGESTHDILIEGNTVKNVADYAIEVGHTTHGTDDLPHRNIIVRGNVIENANCTGIGFRTVSDGLIENNTITGYAKNHSYGCNAIFIEGRVSLMNNIDVKNNVIKQTYPKVMEQRYPYQQAIYLTGIDGMNVSGNEIYNSWNDAIYVLASYAPSPTPDFPDGRRLYKNIQINNNSINNSEVNGVHFDEYQSSGNTVLGNIIQNSGANDILIEGDMSRVQLDGVTNPEQPSDEINLWENPTAFNPLPKFFPESNKQTFEAGTYKLSFNAMSPSGAILNPYVQDRRIFNENITLSDTMTYYEFTFTSPIAHELVIHDKNTAQDIVINTIKLVEVNEEQPETPNELELLIEQIKLSPNRDKLIEVIELLLDL